MLEQFYLSYYGIYLLLIPMLIKGFIELNLYVNRLILKEITKSVVISKYENFLNLDKGATMDINDFELTKANVYYDSVEEALIIENKVLTECNILLLLKENLTKYTWYFIFIRLFYVFIWSYILYYFLLPIIKTCFIFFYNYILIYFPQILFLIPILLIYVLFKK